MDPDRIALLGVSALLLVQPAAVLVWSWWKFKGQRLGWLSRTVLSLTTASCLFLWLAGLIHRPLLGSDYSNRLYTTITINLVANVLLMIMSALRLGPWRRRVCLAGSSGLVALAWFYLLAINSVV